MKLTWRAHRDEHIRHPRKQEPRDIDWPSEAALPAIGDHAIYFNSIVTIVDRIWHTEGDVRVTLIWEDQRFKTGQPRSETLDLGEDPEEDARGC